MPQSSDDFEPPVLFERLAAVTDAMVFVTDLEANQTMWVNDALVEATGYTLDDYRFERFENPFIPAEDVARVGEFLGAFLASEDLVSGVVRNRFTDRWGGTLHVRSRCAKVPWGGRPSLLYATVVEEKAMEPSLEVHERYRSLVEAASDSIVRLRPDLTMHFSNRCFQDLVGRSPVELNALRFVELVAPPQRAEIEAALLGDAPRVPFVAQVLGEEGRARWLEGTFVRIARGPDAGLLQAILRDTTERRRLDERVRLAQKRESLGELAGGIAHDLRNILQGILGSATLAERAVEPGGDVAEWLSDIRLAALRAGELSAAMFAYAGEGERERGPVDLTELVAEMKPLLASSFDKNVTLDVRAPEERIGVSGDQIQLRQVVMNLITNAADATSDAGGVVLVRAGVHAAPPAWDLRDHVFGALPPRGSTAFVCVEDRGHGMTVEVMQRMFDPFFSTKAKGRGLGLAAVLGILDRHGATVRVRSEVGVGTTVEVLLPLADAQIAASVVERAPPARGEGAILVVDDERLIRAVARRSLASVGYEVLEASSGEEAIGLLSEHGARVAAVLLDQSMPGMGGDRAIVEMRALFPHLPVVRTSGYPAESLDPDDDLTRFLGKPYGVNQLIRTLQDVIAVRPGDFERGPRTQGTR